MLPTRTLLLLVTVGACFAEQEQRLGSGLRVLYSVYRQCEDSNDSFTCLKARAIKLIDRAINAESIPIVDGISLVKRPESETTPASVQLEPLTNDFESRAAKVDDLLWQRVIAFLDTHSIQFKVPSFIRDYMYDENDVEGRGKKKKILPALLLGLMFKGSLLAIALKGLALLAGKALLVSKLALVLAGIIALKKLFSSGHEKTTYEIVKQPIVSHSHEYTSSHEGGFEHGYRRSLDSDVPHRLAFKAQLQQKQQQEKV